MITIHRYYADNDRTKKNFMRNTLSLKPELTNDELENRWRHFISRPVDIDEIFGIKPFEDTHSKVYFHDEYGGYNLFEESADEVRAMIKEEEDRINAEEEKDKVAFLTDIFDWFKSNSMYLDGKPIENVKKNFIETFKDKL